MADDPKISVPVDASGRLQIEASDRPTGFRREGATLPTLAEMRGMSDDELMQLLQEFGVAGPWSQLVSDSFGYATEMSKISNIGTPGYIEREVSRLLEPHTGRRALLGLARETQRAFIIEAYENEAPGQEFIRISEDDEHTCDRCDALAGIIGTMGEHASMGLPGPASCDGGAYCRCVLVLVD